MRKFTTILVFTILTLSLFFVPVLAFDEKKAAATALETMLSDASKSGWTPSRISVVLNSIEKLKSDKGRLREVFGKFDPDQLTSIPENVATKYVLAIAESSDISKPGVTDMYLVSKYDPRLSEGLVYMANDAKNKASAVIETVSFSTGPDGKLISSIATDKGTMIVMKHPDGKLQLSADLKTLLIEGGDGAQPEHIPVDTANRRITVNPDGSIEQLPVIKAQPMPPGPKAGPQPQPPAPPKVTVLPNPRPQPPSLPSRIPPQKTSQKGSSAQAPAKPIVFGEAKSVPKKSNSIFWPDLPWAQVAFGITPEYSQTAAYTGGDLNLNFESGGKIAQASIPKGGSFSLSGFFEALFGPLFGSKSPPFQWRQASGEGSFEPTGKKSYRVVWNSREVGQVVFCVEPCKDLPLSVTS